MRLRSNVTNEKTMKFTKKFFFYTILGFTQSQSGTQSDFEGFVQLIPGSQESHKLIIKTDVEKIHLKCDCFNDSIVNGIREPILYSFALDLPPGLKIYEEKEPRTILFKKINKSVLSHNFFLKDDDKKPVDFIGETISIACQLVKV